MARAASFCISDMLPFRLGWSVFGCQQQALAAEAERSRGVIMAEEQHRALQAQVADMALLRESNTTLRYALFALHLAHPVRLAVVCHEFLHLLLCSASIKSCEKK